MLDDAWQAAATTLDNDTRWRGCSEHQKIRRMVMSEDILILAKWREEWCGWHQKDTSSRKMKKIQRWASLCTTKNPGGNPRVGRAKNTASDYKRYISRVRIWHHIWWDGQKYGKKYGGKYGGLALEIMGLIRPSYFTALVMLIHKNEEVYMMRMMEDSCAKFMECGTTAFLQQQLVGKMEEWQPREINSWMWGLFQVYYEIGGVSWLFSLRTGCIYLTLLSWLWMRRLTLIHESFPLHWLSM